MKIKLLKQYYFSPAGTILDPEINVANELIRRGIAEKYDEPIKLNIKKTNKKIKK